MTFMLDLRGLIVAAFVACTLLYIAYLAAMVVYYRILGAWDRWRGRR